MYSLPGCTYSSIVVIISPNTSISVPLETFVTNPANFVPCHEHVLEKSAFLRTVVVKAQFIVNHYILTYHKHVTNALFEQNFWYTVCRVVYGSARIEDVEARYPEMTGFAEAYYTLSIHHQEVNLSVYCGYLAYYGQIVSSACITLATTYENYYVENFEDTVAKYFIYYLRLHYPMNIYLSIYLNTPN
ncbi:hypothetical protein BDF20DRAFT_127837 [Mycotypha africana]|uniref:uncharacterized protein n=1 Tax=Mycotypha africana TaxID=64632 RepID=UPI002301D86C|nr:uncharacterized protein BDF20DRAFT_127837 [Mycotypha africana]KAI8970488.1 hypothetical protein BDF20DRAFT_127837 [Mycotypha africana]